MLHNEPYVFTCSMIFIFRLLYEAQRRRPAPRSWAVSLVPKKTAHRVGRYAVRAGPPLSAEGPSDKGS